VRLLLWALILLALPGWAQDSIGGVRIGMTAAEVKALLGPPTKQGPTRPPDYHEVPLSPAGWWVMYVGPGQSRRDGPPPLDIGFDKRGGRVTAVLGAELKPARSSAGPPLFIVRGSRCYHQFADYGLLNCGQLDTPVIPAPVYVLTRKAARLQKPRGLTVDGVPLNAPLASFLGGLAVSNRPQTFHLGHDGSTELGFKHQRIRYVRGKRLVDRGRVLAEAGWKRPQLDATLGPRARTLRRSGCLVLLYPKYLARVYVYNGVQFLEVGVRPYPGELTRDDFTAAEIAAFTRLR